MDNEEDLDIDDILNHQNKKKSINQKKKGNRNELNLCKILSARFPGKNFSRSVGSGNRWSQTRLTETAMKLFSSDIICPDDFVWSLEAKAGYNKINLELALERLKKGKKGNATLEKFLKQAEKDAERAKKKPLVAWKRDWKPWIVFIKEDLSQVKYKEWAILSLEELLQKEDSFFFACG